MNLDIQKKFQETKLGSNVFYKNIKTFFDDGGEPIYICFSISDQKEDKTFNTDGASYLVHLKRNSQLENIDTISKEDLSLLARGLKSFTERGEKQDSEVGYKIRFLLTNENDPNQENDFIFIRNESKDMLSLIEIASVLKAVIQHLFEEYTEYNTETEDETIEEEDGEESSDYMDSE